MTIKKFSGKTEEEAKQNAREALGNSAVIMNVKEIRPKGILGVFKNSTFEVTAAVEDSATGGIGTKKGTPANQNSNSTFSAVVDDDMQLSKNAPATPSSNMASNPSALGTFTTSYEQSQLMDAFKEVNSIIAEAAPQDVPAESRRPQTAAPTEEMYNGPAEPSSNYGSDIVPLHKTAPTLHVATEEPKPAPTYERPKPVPVKAGERNLEDELSAKTRSAVEISNRDTAKTNNRNFIKTLYNVLIDNEVQERYINQVVDDMDQVLEKSHSLENLLSSVYQKMVLKMGTPEPVRFTGKKPKVVFFIGPTGVGKTTTLAKIAADLKINQNKNVTIITADTYRMSAVEQLRNYAEIMNMPLKVVYEPADINEAIKGTIRNNEETDVILVDTTGFSHKNTEQRDNVANLIAAVDDVYDRSIYLVLSATTKYRDLCDITDTYSKFTRYNLIFTKLDETTCYGNIFNIRMKTAAPLSYICTGQNVPDDIEVINTQKLVKNLLEDK